MGEKETLVGVGILATIGVVLYSIFKKDKLLEVSTVVQDTQKLYDDALKDIQSRHITDVKVVDTLKQVADDIASKVDTSLPLKGIVIVEKEVRDIITEQLSKLGGGGGDTKRLFT